MFIEYFCECYSRIKNQADPVYIRIEEIKQIENADNIIINSFRIVKPLCAQYHINIEQMKYKRLVGVVSKIVCHFKNMIDDDPFMEVSNHMQKRELPYWINLDRTLAQQLPQP